MRDLNFGLTKIIAMTRCCQCENQALVSVETQCDLCQGQIQPELIEVKGYSDLQQPVVS